MTLGTDEITPIDCNLHSWGIVFSRPTLMTMIADFCYSLSFIWACSWCWVFHLVTGCLSSPQITWPWPGKNSTRNMLFCLSLNYTIHLQPHYTSRSKIHWPIVQVFLRTTIFILPICMNQIIHFSETVPCCTGKIILCKCSGEGEDRVYNL